MNKFDETIKKNATEHPIETPASVREHIDEILADLPETPEAQTSNVVSFPKKRSYSRYLSTAACIAFVFFFAMPNLSSNYALAMSKIPILGEVIEVLTIRSYNYEDGNYELDIKVPGIDAESESAADINATVADLTDQVVVQFYDDLEKNEGKGHGAVNIDYTVLTNTKQWFTLHLIVAETAASSNLYYKYYHIDKESGQNVALGDLFQDDHYAEVITAEIKSQMERQMQKDDAIEYFVNDPDLGDDFITIDAKHNFYINKEGSLVIPFDKYEVAPGSMGCPEFEIPTKTFKNLLKNEYRDLFS